MVLSIPIKYNKPADLFDLSMKLLQVRLDLGLMALKKYFILLRSRELEFSNQIYFSVIPRKPFFVRVSLAGVTVSVI